MPYRYATKAQDFSDYASGRVFFNAVGQPALPVRLTSELFQRCLAARRQLGHHTPALVYDPCCGSAYHLNTLAYLHWPQIQAIIGSDIDDHVLGVAERNLGLLTRDGLAKRIDDIASLAAQFGRPSHSDALASAKRLQRQLQQHQRRHAVETALFSADLMAPTLLQQGLNGRQVDIVIADVPYGRHSAWQTSAELPSGVSRLHQMLTALLTIVSDHTILAIVTDKAQKGTHDAYRRIERFQIGKRRITLLRRKVG